MKVVREAKTDVKQPQEQNKNNNCCETIFLQFHLGFDIWICCLHLKSAPIVAEKVDIQ